jgi:hypothetical protein
VQVSPPPTAGPLISQAAARFDADITTLLSRLPPRDRHTLTRLVTRLLTAHAADQGIDLFATAAPGSNHPK